MNNSSHRLAVPRLKGRFPFRLGTTSYIIPDQIEPNVRALAPWVDDIELVLFESDEISNLPSEAEIATLADIAARYHLTYTIHLPLDTQFGSPDEEIRRSSVAKALRVFQLTAPLSPHAYIAHCHGERRGETPAQNIAAWLARLDRSFSELLEAGMPAAQLAVETLDYPFEILLPLIEECDLAVCLDVGHLILAGRDPVAVLADLRNRCRVVHLHGVRERRDHVDVAALAPGILAELYQQLLLPGGPECVVTLEVFDQAHFERSMQVLAEVWT